MPDLNCSPAPARPAPDADDVAIALWINALDQAGQDCRDHLAAVAQEVSTWPKE